MKVTKIITNKLLIINLSLIILAILADKFWNELGLTESENIYYFLLGVMIFGLSIIGVFVGVKERKEKGNKVLIGLFGNSIIVLLFLIVFFYIMLVEL